MLGAVLWLRYNVISFRDTPWIYTRPEHPQLTSPQQKTSSLLVVTHRRFCLCCSRPDHCCHHFSCRAISHSPRVKLRLITIILTVIQWQKCRQLFLSLSGNSNAQSCTILHNFFDAKNALRRQLWRGLSQFSKMHKNAGVWRAGEAGNQARALGPPDGP